MQEDSSSRPNHDPGQGMSTERGAFALPSPSLPKGGGAIQGIGEKFSVNPATGTASFSIPISTPPGRSGFGPQLSLSYDSGVGNGPFGLGWTLNVPEISRKTALGLPRYFDDEDCDVFLLSDAEDLVPKLETGTGGLLQKVSAVRVVAGVTFRVDQYLPRIEGLFARIERWTDSLSGQVHWRSISRDNITTLYGRTSNSRVEDPSDPSRVFAWRICESHDDRGNAIRYEYKPEDSSDVDLTQTNERNRSAAGPVE